MQRRLPATAGFQPSEGAAPDAHFGNQPRQAWHRARRTTQARRHHARFHYTVSTMQPKYIDVLLNIIDQIFDYKHN